MPTSSVTYLGPRRPAPDGVLRHDTCGAQGAGLLRGGWWLEETSANKNRQSPIANRQSPIVNRQSSIE
ncbi:MAG: hypothetical protein MUD01_16585 [Chloroflexaceae bacterium]|nr:hypothetical protein [Chloroflexaceae bacterium]